MKKYLMFIFLLLFCGTLSARYIFDGKIIFSKHATDKDSLAYLIIEKAGGVLDTFAIIDSSGYVYWKYPLRIVDDDDTTIVGPEEIYSKLGRFNSIVCSLSIVIEGDGYYLASKGWNLYVDYDDDDRYAKIWFHGPSNEALVADSAGEVLSWTGKKWITTYAELDSLKSSYAEHDSILTGKLKVKLDVSQTTDTLEHIQADTSGIDRNVTVLLINGESINNASDFAIKTEDKDGNVLFSVKGDGVIEGYNLNKQFSYQCAGDIFNIAPNTVALLGWITPVTTEQDLSPHNNDFDYHNFIASHRVAKGLVWKLNFPTDPPNGFLHTTDSDDFSFIDGEGDGFTMGGWQQVVASSDSQTIWAKWDETVASPQREWNMFLDANEKLVMALWDESNDGDPYRKSDAAISVGWHLMLAVYTGTGGMLAADGITLYVDGKPVASTPTNDIGYVRMENTIAYPYVGGIDEERGVSTKDHWQGDMGHQFITTDQLTADEAWEMYLRTRGYYNE